MSHARPSRRPGIAAVGLLAVLLSNTPALAQSVDPYHSIGLEWTATGDDSTAGRASAYELHYSTTDPSTTSLDSWWTSQSTAVSSGALPVPKTAGSTDSTRVNGLSSGPGGTTYFFIIRARDDGGNYSPYSNIASAQTAACSAPGLAPGSFAADTLGVTAVLSWSDPGDPNAASLHLYRGVGGSGSLSLYRTLSSGSTSFTDTNVSPGTTYRYRMAYAAVCNDEGPSTTTLSVTFAGTPPSVTASSEATIHSYPNPSKSGDAVQIVIDIKGQKSVPVRLRLFDPTGHWVADVANGVYSPGSNTISWSRAGRNGHALAPGYYEILGTAGSQRVRERILLLP